MANSNKQEESNENKILDIFNKKKETQDNKNILDMNN